MVVVQLDGDPVDVNRHRLRARRHTMATLDVVYDDVKIGVLYQVVGAGAHEIESLSIKCHVVRVSNCRTGFLTLLRCAVPVPCFAGATK